MVLAVNVPANAQDACCAASPKVWPFSRCTCVPRSDSSAAHACAARHLARNSATPAHTALTMRHGSGALLCMVKTHCVAAQNQGMLSSPHRASAHTSSTPPTGSLTAGTSLAGIQATVPLAVASQSSTCRCSSVSAAEQHAKRKPGWPPLLRTGCACRAGTSSIVLLVQLTQCTMRFWERCVVSCVLATHACWQAVQLQHPLRHPEICRAG